MSMGRPVTPAPEGGENGKATFAMVTVLLGIVSLVIGIVVVAVPYWGYFAPQTQYGSGRGVSNYWGGFQEGSGYFGPFLLCAYTPGGWGSACDGSVRFKKEVYVTIAGICAIVGVVATGLFAICAGLHCAMQINNRHIFLSYRRNIFCALVTAVISDLGFLGSVILAAFQFTSRRSEYTATMGPMYYLQILLIFLNFILIILAVMSYRKVKKTNFPRQRAPYEISANRYEPDPAHPPSGITVTQNSGQLYPPVQQQQQPPPYLPTQLPAFPAPANGLTPFKPQLQQTSNNLPFRPQQGTVQAYYNEGNTIGATQMAQMAHMGPTTLQGQTTPYLGSGGAGLLRGQTAQPQVQTRPVAQVTGRPAVPHRDDMVAGVSLNPVGRTAAFNNLKGPTGAGSMESLDSTKSSTLSFGSTGSAEDFYHVMLMKNAQKASSSAAVSTAHHPPLPPLSHPAVSQVKGSSLDSTLSNSLSFDSILSGTGSPASINAPLRSSMKKAKNKEIASVSSNISKKSVTIAIGAEQTAV